MGVAAERDAMTRLLTILAMILGLALPVGAATIEERIAAELRAQGYEILEENRTLLGRLRIVAENDQVRREIVLNPGTGEILRDYSVLLTVLERRTRQLALAAKSPSHGSSGGSPTGGPAGSPTTTAVAGAAIGDDGSAGATGDAALDPGMDVGDDTGDSATSLPSDRDSTVTGEGESSVVPLLSDPLLPIRDE